MLASIFILIFLLPAVCLPLALDTFFSSSELDEMGICRERSDEPFPMQGYELVGFLPDPKNCEIWEINKSVPTYR